MHTVNICFICDEKYALPTGVAISSVIANRNRNTAYDIYIVGVNLSRDTIATLRKLKTDGVNIIIKNTTNTYDNIDTHHIYVSKAAMMKFDLPNIFNDLDKILYLDGDMLILHDLRELYNIDIKNKYAAVVADMAGEFEGHATKIGHKQYFNSGMVLLNLKKMRHDNITQKLVDAKKNDKFNHFMDQDALNVVMGNGVVYISPIYNYMGPNLQRFSNKQIREFFHIDFDLGICNAVIVHLTNVRKVWEYTDTWGYDLWEPYKERYYKRIYGPFRYLMHRIIKHFHHHKFYVKERLPNGRRHIYILGIKVASYSKKETPYYNFDYEIKKYLGFQKCDDIKTIILGSSHARDGYTPGDGEYNMANSSLDLYRIYNLYKYAIKYKKHLKNVIVFWSVFHPGLQLEKTDAKLLVCPPYKALYGIDYACPLTGDDQILKFVRKRLKQIARHGVPADFRGQSYYDIVHTDIASELVAKHIKNTRRHNNQIEYLGKMVKLAREHGHKLYVVLPPYRQDYLDCLPGDDDIYFELFEFLNKNPDVQLLNFQRDPDFVNSDFDSVDHCDLAGATKLTKKIKKIVYGGQ